MADPLACTCREYPHVQHEAVCALNGEVPELCGVEDCASQWPDAHIPRTDRPSRFVAEEAWIGADTFRTVIVS